MSIPLHISPKIIPSIATLYNDTNRIFMEYVDNSLDSAEEYFDQNLNGYNRPIEISVKVIGSNYKSGQVLISDNCFGITNFEKVVQSIGNSDKKAQAWTNGQFGYGIYSFMAACGRIEVTSRIENNDALYIPIEREQFNTERQEDVKFPNPQSKRFDRSSGTDVLLSNFDKDMWRVIDVAVLRSEIEKHFELLLVRNNLKVELIDEQGNSHLCRPFDYDQYEGEIYEDFITDLHMIRGKKVQQRITIDAPKPIRVFLKVTKGKTINKPPVFVSKGRRIGEIKDIRAFKSNHRLDLWGHPNVTGYIDLVDFLSPTIARTEFKNDTNSRALFNTLIDLEPAILEVVKKVNVQSEEKHYQQLEDRLNQVLSKLARIDLMNYRTEYLSGADANLEGGGIGRGMEAGFGLKDYGEDGSGGEGGIGENEGDGEGIGETEGNIPANQEGGEDALNKEQFEDSEFKGVERKKSGFNIKIDNRDPDIDVETNKPLRSVLVGDEIRIFKKHPDFEDRVRTSHHGGKKITERLVTYLAGEVTVHYKDRFYDKVGQPEYSKKMFEGLVDFIYRIENMLTDLVGKDLSDLG